MCYLRSLNKFSSSFLIKSYILLLSWSILMNLANKIFIFSSVRSNAVVTDPILFISSFFNLSSKGLYKILACSHLILNCSNLAVLLSMSFYFYICEVVGRCGLLGVFAILNNSIRLAKIRL